MERRTQGFLVFAALAGLAGSALVPGSPGCNPLTGQCPGGIQRPTAETSVVPPDRPGESPPPPARKTGHALP